MSYSRTQESNSQKVVNPEVICLLSNISQYSLYKYIECLEHPFKTNLLMTSAPRSRHVDSRVYLSLTIASQSKNLKFIFRLLKIPKGVIERNLSNKILLYDKRLLY